MPYSFTFRPFAAPLSVLCLSVSCLLPAYAQDDTDLLAPLNASAVRPDLSRTADDSDFLAPLDPSAIREDLSPGAQNGSKAAPPSEDDWLLAPLDASSVDPRYRKPGKPDETPEEAMQTAAALMQNNKAADMIAKSIRFADAQMREATKGISDAKVRKAIQDLEKFPGQGGSGPTPNLPLEIDMAEALEWQKRQKESNGKLVLVEYPVPYTDCSSGTCIDKLRMHYELQPVQGVKATGN